MATLKEIALIITAHCDDAELWAGGTILNYVNKGWTVIVAVANHCEKRRKEASYSASILGTKILFHPIEQVLSNWISTILEEHKPTVLVTHSPNDPHIQHRQCHEATLKALIVSKSRSQYPARWYVFDQYYLTAQLVGCPILVDISEYVDCKLEALRAHKSQNPEELIDMALAMNRLHGMKIRVRYAEAFYPFPLLGRWPHLRHLP